MAKSFAPGSLDEVDGLRDLARRQLHRDAVAQPAVDGLVVRVEAAAVVVRLGAQGMDGLADLRRGVAALGQMGSKQPFFDVAIAVPVGPVTEVAVPKLIAEKRDDAGLRGSFRLADGGHLRGTACFVPLRGFT